MAFIRSNNEIFNLVVYFCKHIRSRRTLHSNDNDVIATSSTPLAATLTLQELATLFEQTQYAGQTESKQGLLKRYLEQQVNTSHDPEILYYYVYYNASINLTRL